MLRLIIPGDELFDDETQTFSTLDDYVLELEHSLVSLSKWESEFQKPFLSSHDKSSQELISYIRHMIIDDSEDPDVLLRLSDQNISDINAYIESPQSATTFGSLPDKKARGETITSELIYYWLIAFTIPFSCENWHLNRLFSLIKICNIKNSNPKKMSKHEIAQRNRDINAQRKAQLKTTG